MKLPRASLNAPARSHHLTTGELGEAIAAQWLLGKQYSVIERNYRKKWGEIDIITRDIHTSKEATESIRFIEVKSVSYETREELNEAVHSREWRPEERVDNRKLTRLVRAVETWVHENTFSAHYQLDVLIVRMVPREKYAQVAQIENVYPE